MTDIFNEIDDELRRDKVAQFWKRHGAKVVVLAIVVVVGVGGWRFYEHRQRVAAEAAGARFDAAVQLARDGKTAEAEQAFAAIAQDGGSAYRVLAQLRAAAEAGRGDPEKGAAAFDALASNPGVPGDLQQLARLRAAALRLDVGGDPKAVMAALEPLATPTAPFRNSARELLGLAALKAGDYEAAGRWFDQIVTDRTAPQALQSRVQIYLALVGSGPVPATQ